MGTDGAGAAGGDKVNPAVTRTGGRGRGRAASARPTKGLNLGSVAHGIS